ncbi:hypothetical protein B0J11DRAFT_510351 [Dendryphion nanum]|uniref:Uncharacterized protein n=1 Tax=Dendryphion nanum TaxID=256645 RepID=A0A9P9DBL2_9PLEO|nr:hypothetical protein B0J11DRAFT_510351 [Dendryphion nanum]
MSILSPNVTSSSTLPIPISGPADPDKSSFCDLPAEIRLVICNYLLDANNIPRTYGYTGPVPISTSRSMVNTGGGSAQGPRIRKHALGFASKQIGAEYRQAFYERTRFFLRIDDHNAFRAIPSLSQSATTPPPTLTDVPNFWRAPDALLTSLRHCTLYIELGDIASAPQSTHSLAQVIRASQANSEATRVREEMKTFSSYDQLKEQDTIFDHTIQDAIYNLLQHMGQLRSVQVIWDTTSFRHRNMYWSVSSQMSVRAATKWQWKDLGEPLVERLQQRRQLKKLQVKVGDMHEDWVYNSERVEGGGWKGGREGRESGHEGFEL